MNPTMFIGSSFEASHLAYELESLVRRKVDCTVWPNAFQMSRDNMDNLMSTFRRMEFGAFILAPDDQTTMRDQKTATARDNVILEIGLFAGDRDLRRTFMVRPDDVPNLRIPSDLGGITATTYSSTRAESESRNAMSPAATDILSTIELIVGEERRLDFKIFARAEPQAHWRLKFYVQVTNNTGESVAIRSLGMELNRSLEPDYELTQGRIVPQFVIDKQNGRDVFDSTVLLRHAESTQIWLPLLSSMSADDINAVIRDHKLGIWRYEECWLSTGRVRSRTKSI